MAGLTTKGVYGLAAMHVLMHAPRGRAMQIKEIAAMTDISHAYLEQLLGQLRRAKLVESIRGASGGYRLAKNASEISVLEILETLEGNVCRYEGAVGNSVILKSFWEDAALKMQAVFSLKLSEIDAMYTPDFYAI